MTADATTIIPGGARHPRARAALRAAGIVAALAAPLARGQCTPRWSAVNSEPTWAYAVSAHDEDGEGPLPPAIFAGGPFSSIDHRPTRHVARFDSHRWTMLGEGMQSLYPTVYAVHAIERSRTVPRGVYFGGIFTLVDGVPVRHLARWDSGRWLDVGGGTDPYVLGLGAWDPNRPRSTGESLLVGGMFRRVGGIPADGIARWDGQHWSDFSGGLRRGQIEAYMWTACLYDDDGPGPNPFTLHIGGSFYSAGSSEILNIAKWDGVRWSALGWGATAQVESLQVYDPDGPGPAPASLYAGGDFSRVGSAETGWIDVYGFARWDGRRWSAVPGWHTSTVQAMTVFDDDGPGPNPSSLFIGGGFLRLGTQPAGHIGKWDGQSWTPLPPLSGPFGVDVQDMTVWDEDGEGPHPGGLYVAGRFYYAGNLLSPAVARWGCPLPPRCEADCDQSTSPGVLDIFDFLCFQNRYTIQDPWACDCDFSTGPSLCDLFDFLCFQNHFAGGCP